MPQTAEVALHTFNRSEDDLPIFLSTLSSKCHGLKTESPHRHTFYEILFITGGEGTHIVDFENYRLQSPTVYFVSPGQIHFWRLNAFLEGYALVFCEDFLIFPGSSLKKAEEIGFFYNTEKTPELRLNNHQHEKMDQLLQLVRDERLSETARQASVLRAYLHILIVELQRLYALNGLEHHASYELQVVRRFKRLITERFKTEKSVANYASEMGISTSHLNNILKEKTGRSPGALIRNEVVLEAKRLLVHSALTVAEIGYRLNFEDPSYFARFFKREAGMSPTLFRSAIREKYQIFHQ